MIDLWIPGLLLLLCKLSMAFNPREPPLLHHLQHKRPSHHKLVIFGQIDDKKEQKNYFVREALPPDLGFASGILADGFFATRNIFAFQVEKLKTYLSLEACFPQFSSKDMHKYLVACDKRNGKVIAFAEVDCRPTKDLKRPTPYMCNLAIDKKWKRKGIATALIHECEDIASKHPPSEGIENRLYLKVRTTNTAAIKMYEGQGYSIESSALERNPQESNGKEGAQLVHLMSKVLKEIM